MKELIKKLEDCANFYANDPGWKNSDLALGIAQGVNLALNIIKGHSEWVSVDERLPHPEDMLTHYYNPNEFYEIILKTGELLTASYTHIKNDGNNKILFMACTIELVHGEWVLLNDGFEVYESDDVAYWKPITQPPSEV